MPSTLGQWDTRWHSLSPKNPVEGVGDEVLLLVAAQAEQLGPQPPAELLRRDPCLLLLQFFEAEHLGKEEPAVEGAQHREGTRASFPPQRQQHPGGHCHHSARTRLVWSRMSSASTNHAPSLPPAPVGRRIHPHNTQGKPPTTHLVAVTELGVRAPSRGAGGGEAGRGVGTGQLGVHRGAQVLPADVLGLEGAAVLHLPQPHGAAGGQGHAAALVVTWSTHGSGEEDTGLRVGPRWVTEPATALHGGDDPIAPVATPLPGWSRFQWVYITSSPLSQRNAPVSFMSCSAVQKYSPSQP